MEKRMRTRRILVVLSVISIVFFAASCSSLTELALAISGPPTQTTTKSTRTDSTGKTTKSSKTTETYDNQKSAVEKATATVIPSGSYVRTDSKTDLQCFISGKSFSEVNQAATKVSDMISGTYSIKSKVVHIDGKATDFTWDGKTLKKGSISFKREASEDSNFSEL